MHDSLRSMVLAFLIALLHLAIPTQAGGQTEETEQPLLTDVVRRPAAVSDDGPVRSAAQAHRAVWRIHNLGPGETFGDREGHYEGSAFAIGPRHFITALHVLLGVLEGADNLGSLTLLQEGNPAELRVNRVLAVNVAHDLAYLETRHPVIDYLNLVYQERSPLEAYEDAGRLGAGLTLVGYLEGSLVRQEASKGIIYEDVYAYAFATDYPGLHGLSGSPVVNANGQVVGVAVSAQDNIVEAMKISYVAQLLSGEKGVTCSELPSLESCLAEGVRTVKAMANQGDVLSLYAMGSEHGEMEEIDPTFVLSVKALYAAAKKGLPAAEYEIALYFQSMGRRKASFEWLESSAMKGNPQAVYFLGRAYLAGWGTEKDETLGNTWLEKSRKQGYEPGG